MQNADNLFTRFGGTREMARHVGESPSTVDGWKRRRRISSKKQAGVLAAAERLNLKVTAEDVMFPFPEDRVTR